jgi:hypothetical protein
MFGSISKISQAWLLGALVAFGATAIDATATTCSRSSNGYFSQLNASNFTDTADDYGCPRQAVTALQIWVAIPSSFEVYTTGVFHRCATSSDLIWFFGAGGLHVFETANGGIWGAVGGGLCSFYSYNGYPFSPFLLGESKG